MMPESPASSTSIGQDGQGVIGQTVIGATVIYGSVTIIQGLQATSAEANAGQTIADSFNATAPTPTEEGPNPYQGLLAFQPSDGNRFFGRATEIEDLWQSFRALHELADATRLLVVYGPSGSGKSSLVRAGLVPELARRPPGGRAQARIALLVPGSQPLQALASVLARIATNDPAPVRKTREFAEELALPNGSGEHDGLRRIAALLPEADVWPLVVVVDQLEELYSLCPEAATRQVLLSNLLQAAADPSGQVAVVVTLRSDFLGATQADPALNRLIQAQGVFVAALSEQGLRDAIRLPAERRARPLETATVDLLVEQSLGRDGALPLLQFALLRIWEGMLRGQPAAETLREMGGVGGALAGEADRIHAGLPPDDQRIARRLFLNLVQLGEGSRDTRRRVALQELIAHGEDGAAVHRVTERFASPAVRLITCASGQDGNETLELSHEALIEAWPLLQDWLNSSRSDLLFQRRLEEAARHWQTAGQPEGSLWRPPDLDLLDRFREVHNADLTPLQLAFAAASREAELGRRERERRNQTLLRGGLLALSGLTLLALGSGGFAWHQLHQAQEAQELQFEASHRALIASDPFASLVFGLAAAEPLLDGQHPWEAAQLSTTLPVAMTANRAVTIPIATGQDGVLSLIELKNGELISGGGDGSLRRWRDGKPVGDGKPIPTGQVSVRSMIELKNGELISGGVDGSLRRWRDGMPVGDGKPIPTSQGEIYSLIELRNGEIISGGEDGSLRRWRDGKPVGDGKPIPTDQVSVRSMIELKNGELISGGQDGSLRRWRDGKPVGDGKSIPTDQGIVWSIIELKNGELISGGGDGSLRRWRDGKPVGDGQPIATGQKVVMSLIELKNGELISGGGYGSLRRWRDGQPVGDGKPIALTQGKEIWSLIQLKNGELISGGADGSLQRWRVGKPVYEDKPIATGQGQIHSLIELRNGEIISGGDDGSLRRWRDSKPLGDGKPIDTGQAGVRNLIELRNGELISGGLDSMRRWRDGKPVGDGKPIDIGWVLESLIELRNGEIISGDQDGLLRRWRDGKPVVDGKPIDTGQALGQRGVLSLIELKNGELISGGGDGSLRRWRDGKPVGDGKPIPTGQAGVTRLIELKNGELISGGGDGSLRRWRDGKPVGDGKLISTGTAGGVMSLIELRNGELISGGNDGSLRRWRDGKPVGDGKPIATGQEYTESMLVLKNGDLLTGGSDSSLRRWSIKPAVFAICRSIDLSSGTYPAAMQPAVEAARRSCRKVGAAN